MASRPKQADIEALVSSFNQKRYDEVERKSRALLGLHPDNSILYNMLGAAQTAQDKLDPAIACLERSIQLNPRHPGTYNNLGMALRKKGELDRAVDEFKRAVARKADYYVAHNNLGDTLVEAKRGPEAIAVYEKLLRHRPSMLGVYLKLGSALREHGKPEGAVEVYERALDIAFDNPAVHNNLGNVLAELGRREEAASAFRQSIRHQPQQAMAYYNLHALQLADQDPSAAIDSLRTAVRQSPGEGTLELFLGVTLDHAGQADEAEAMFQRAARWTELDRARLAAWNYIKARSQGRCPRLLGCPRDMFELAVEYAQVEGQILEFGVRFGTSIRQLASLSDQEIHGFDSFEGLPEAWDDAAAGEYSTGGVMPDVPERVHLHAGWFEDSLPPFIAVHPEPVRLMNIDCDLYSSTKTVLDAFRDQIVPGTVLIFDEYVGNINWHADELKAFEEFVAATGLGYEYLACSLYTKQVVVRVSS